MTHNLIHLEHPVQKAGQTGTALLPLPSNYGVRRRAAAFANTQPTRKSISGSPAPASTQCSVDSDFVFPRPQASSGADRVAGGESAGNQTSTAALASIRHGLLPTQRRAPRPRGAPFVVSHSRPGNDPSRIRSKP